jgi:hypothetical protein
MCAMSPRLLRPRASGFNPKSIAGLQLWLDAADSSTITVDTGVSEWADKSGVGSKKFVQTTGNNQPATGTQTLNGKNVLVFDGSNDSLSISSPPMSTSMPLSMFIVQRIVSSTNFGMTYTAGTGNDFNVRQASTTGVMEFIAPAVTSILNFGTSSVGLNEVITMIFPDGATDNRIYRSGTLRALGGSPQAKPTLTGTHYIGQRSDGLYANIWMAELLAYSADLSDSQRKAVESYLGKKWGITVA